MEVERVIHNAAIQLLRENPFFGHILIQLPKVFTAEAGPTFAVTLDSDGVLVKLLINPAYVEEIYTRAKDKAAAFAHIVEVLKHETMHVLFKHLWIDKPDRESSNIAADLSVNSYLNRSKLVDRGIFPEDYDFPPFLGLERYYELLEEKERRKQRREAGRDRHDPRPLPKGQSGAHGGEGHGSPAGSPGDGGSGKQAEKGQKPSGSSSGVGSGEELFKGALDSHAKWSRSGEPNEIANSVLKDIVRKARDFAQSSNSWGNLPGEVRRLASAMVDGEESRIDWRDVLRDFLCSSTESDLDYSNKRISKRFGTRPGTVKRDRLRLAVGVDTSGSISSKVLSEFLREISSLSQDNFEATVFEGDTDIRRETPLRDFLESEIVGGGGTDLEPIIREAADRRFDALIYFTDGDAPRIQERYGIPVILAVYGHGTDFSASELPYPADIVFAIDGDNVEVKS